MPFFWEGRGRRERDDRSADHRGTFRLNANAHDFARSALDSSRVPSRCRPRPRSARRRLRSTPSGRRGEDARRRRTAAGTPTSSTAAPSRWRRMARRISRAWLRGSPAQRPEPLLATSGTPRPRPRARGRDLPSLTCCGRRRRRVGEPGHARAPRRRYRRRVQREQLAALTIRAEGLAAEARELARPLCGALPRARRRRAAGRPRSNSSARACSCGTCSRPRRARPGGPARGGARARRAAPRSRDRHGRAFRSDRPQHARSVVRCSGKGATCVLFHPAELGHPNRARVGGDDVDAHHRATLSMGPARAAA